MKEGLQKQVLQLQEQNNLLQITATQAEEKLRIEEEKNRYLQFQLDQMKRMIFGAKRERFISNADVNQMALPFDIPEQTPTELSVEKIEYTRKKASRENHHGRLELPSHLPAEEIIIEPKESTEGLKCIGQEVTSELDYIPAKLLVRKYIRNKYALPNGEGILIGELPVRPIEKCIAGSGLLSNILVDKFVDHCVLWKSSVWITLSKAVLKMRDGPSESAYRSWFQTTLCCIG